MNQSWCDPSLFSENQTVSVKGKELVLESQSTQASSGVETLLNCKLALGMGGILEGKEAKSFSVGDYVSILNQSVDMGFCLVDTAPAYGDGVSEEIVGQVAEKRRSELLLATKVSPENLDSASIVRSAEASLRRLKTDYLDLLQVHWPNPTISLEETAQGMQLLLEAQKVRWIGVANFSVPELSRFSSFFPDDIFISSQVEMSVIDRFEVSRSLRWTEQNSKVTLAYSPLGKGRLAQNPAIHVVLKKVADRLGVTIPQLLLKWLSMQGRVVPVVASRNPAHLRENFAFQEVVIGDFELQALTQVLEKNQVHHLIPSEVTVATDGDGGRDVYLTVGQAEANPLGFSPSPKEISQQILEFPDIKPVRVQKRGDRFYLVEGRVRYWAWVIAFGDSKKIPAIEVSEVVS